MADNTNAPGREDKYLEESGNFADNPGSEAGHELLERKLREHHESSPNLSGGDVDAAWEDDDVGEESVGGGNPTPDQDVVEELGEAMGVTYEDNEPLRIGDKVAKRDSDRWELNPASAQSTDS
jgi:hypothetical protein